MSPSHLPTKGKPKMAIIATIEDGGGSRSLRFGDKSAETFAQRLVDDYRYRSRLNAAIRRQQAIRRPQFALGPPIDRRDLGVEPSQSVPQMVTEAPAAAPSVLPQARAQGIAAPQQNQLPTNGSAEMDLGDILGGIERVAGTYYNLRTMRQPAPIMAQPVIGGPLAAGISRGLQALRGAAPMLGGGVAGSVVGEFLGPETIPMADYGTDCVKPSDVVYMWDEKLGTYVPKKKRKRRRKQLITQSDIKGLAALKGVVGTGKIMETWIATHC